MFGRLLDVVVGAALAVGAYVIYLAAKKGVPAAAAWVKGKVTAGRSVIAAIAGDLAEAQTAIAALEQRFAGELDKLRAELSRARDEIAAQVSRTRDEIAVVRAKLAQPPGPSPVAPAAPAAAPPAAGG